MITVGYTDGSVVEHSGRPGWACSARGEVFWYPGEERMIVPPRRHAAASERPTPPPDVPTGGNGATMAVEALPVTAKICQSGDER